jgi:hypothetical protein
VQIDEPTVGRSGVRLAGGSAEPTVSADALVAALADDGVERFRPLLPVGYRAGVDAYRTAVEGLDVAGLTDHYTTGMSWFRDELVPHIKRRMSALTGGAWQLDDYVAYAAGSDVDFMTHTVEAIAADRPVSLYPGDWWGFRVGCTQTRNIHWTRDAADSLACLCIPSVRNGHVTSDMLRFLDRAPATLLNINLFPTLPADERASVARSLLPVLDKSILSISFSRGFALTASQLGVALVHKDHPYNDELATQWGWHTYFYNHIAAKAFMAIDFERLETVDTERRAWVRDWLTERGLPAVDSGTYYVKSFRVDGPVPTQLEPLVRDDVVRLCFKPPQT